MPKLIRVRHSKLSSKTQNLTVIAIYVTKKVFFFSNVVWIVSTVFFHQRFPPFEKKVFRKIEKTKINLKQKWANVFGCKYRKKHTLFYGEFHTNFDFCRFPIFCVWLFSALFKPLCGAVAFIRGISGKRETLSARSPSALIFAALTYN